jgi:Lipase (class 3)
MAGSPIDTSEDMEVGLMLAFTAGGGGYISQGAMEAFTDIIMGTELMEILGIFAPNELFVTGHSLGGALVTTVSLYLAQNFLPAKDIYPYTFAAPTAGNPGYSPWNTGWASRPR